MTKDEQKDKIIAEALGLRWRELGPNEECAFINHPNFSSWPGFGLIMTKGQMKKWWKKFLLYIWDKEIPSCENFDKVFMSGRGCRRIMETMNNPPVLRDKLASWLSEHEEEWKER